MANEIDLNDLTIKTDSLPDNWKLMLINPTTGLPAQNVTVARFVELLTSKIGVASMDKAGLAERCQGRTIYSLAPDEFIDIYIEYYGIYLFVSETLEGTSLLFQKSYSKNNFKIILDPSNIQGFRYKLEQLNDGDRGIRVTNLSSSVTQRFSLNRL